MLEMSAPVNTFERFDPTQTLNKYEFSQFLSVNCLKIPWVYYHSNGFYRESANSCIIRPTIRPCNRIPNEAMAKFQEEAWEPISRKRDEKHGIEPMAGKLNKCKVWKKVVDALEMLDDSL